ncbi:class I SAM-dependent methyltransferase [Ruegeria arenilitoris]|uniref:class I SAM-dependent methyltransferase n=1 Tax=Ruegeria arenilitoris TaxID=1173585 RepID=UPI00147C03A8|nr:class I SAM-dependent methyltransferase [Ruegeria arenilitoris]
MAIPDTLAARLIEVTKNNNLGGHFLMLGRQRWIGTRKGKAAKLLADTIGTYLPGKSEEDLKNPNDAYSEQFFKALGYDQVDSLDFSEFENASIIQDLGAELDPALHERFDVIYDGGTCEHIFELPTAYRNIHKMLKKGGVLIAHSPCNNWINHSFYQINPEMVYGFWEKAMGYELLSLILQPLLPNFSDRVVTTTNPNVTGVRPRLKGKLPQNSPIMMCYAVRKPFDTEGKGVAYQTDYMEKWQG